MVDLIATLKASSNDRIALASALKLTVQLLGDEAASELSKCGYDV